MRKIWWIFAVILIGSSAYAETKPSIILCNSATVLGAHTYFGVVTSTTVEDNQLLVTFENYEKRFESNPALSMCSYHSAICETCDVRKEKYNVIVYRPINAVSTVLCHPRSAVHEFRTVESLLNREHSSEHYPGRLVDGKLVRTRDGVSDVRCASWQEQ